jgi:hypothetical protein
MAVTKKTVAATPRDERGREKNQGPRVGQPLFHEFNSPLRRRVAPKVAHDLATRGEVSSLKLVWHNHNDASTTVECGHFRVVKKLSIFCQINRGRVRIK